LHKLFALAFEVCFLNILNSAVTAWLFDKDAILNDKRMVATTLEPSCFSESRFWYMILMASTETTT